MNDLLVACVPLIGRALLHFLWQGGVIGMLAALALFALRHATPQTRYAVACAALLACLLAPLIDIALQLGVGPDSAVLPTGDGSGYLIGTATAAAPAAVSVWASPLEPWLPAIVAMWAAGACMLCLRMACGVAWIERLRSTPQAAAQAHWQARLDAIAARFDLKRAVALRLVEGIPSPVSAGWWRPVVLLPTAVIARMPVELIEALLAHELAHVRRHDYLVNLLQGLVEALLFYHPVVWWLSRQVRIEREHVADRLAADAIDDPRRLAVALAELSEYQAAPSAPPRLAQAAHGGHLMSRIEQLVRPGHRTAGRLAFPLLGIAAACIAFIAHAQIESEAPDARKAAATSTAAATPAPALAPIAGVPLQPGAKGVLGLPSVPDATARASAGARADADAGHGDAYALVRKGRDGMVLSGSTDEIPAINQLSSRIDGDFLWFRRDGRIYTVTDPALIARLGRAWKDSDAIARQMDALGQQMSVHGEKMEALGERMGHLASRQAPSPAMQQAQRRIAELAARQGQLAAQHAKLAVGMSALDEVENARVEREMQAMEAQLEAKMDAIEAEIEREAEQIEAEAERMARHGVPMDALGREMEAASKPMEALGKQMEALGERQERIAAEAEREMRLVIREALERGLAHPADAPSVR